MAPNTKIKLGVLRKGAEKTVEVTLGELPVQQEARADVREPRPDQDRSREFRRGDRDDRRGDRRQNRSESDRDVQSTDGPRLGLSLAPAGSEPGVVVAEVDSNGPAADLGFQAGDVILEVAGKSVATPADVRNALGEARTEGKRSILMRVKSERGTRFVAVPLARA